MYEIQFFSHILNIPLVKPSIGQIFFTLPTKSKNKLIRRLTCYTAQIETHSLNVKLHSRLLLISSLIDYEYLTTYLAHFFENSS